MNFISPTEQLEDADWTANLQEPIDDTFGLVWKEDPASAQPNEG
jgi:hypothetical protein